MTSMEKIKCRLLKMPAKDFRYYLSRGFHRSVYGQKRMVDERIRRTV